MRRYTLSPVLFCFLPALSLIPVLYCVIRDIHGGGLYLLRDFFLAAFQPSLEVSVLNSALKGLQITISIALVSWLVSMFFGIIFALLSSKIFWNPYSINDWRANFFKRILVLPRSIHELIWGLILLQFFGLSPFVAILAISIPFTSIIARVLSEQFDTLDSRDLIALRHTGASSFTAFLTALLPDILPIINSYGGYRLECALRGATLLGVFGLGGIGTEMQLTLQSLEFKEFWTSLWILGLVVISLERFLIWTQKDTSNHSHLKKRLFVNILLISIPFIAGFIWLDVFDYNRYSTLHFSLVHLPNLSDIRIAFYTIPILEHLVSTLALTLLAAGIAIGIAPLALITWPTRLGSLLQGFLWAFFRLVPSPLLLLLLLLCTSPTVFVAALALGLNNLGVMGRLLQERLSQQNKECYWALLSSGAGLRTAWLYGAFCPQSKSYLAYAGYRTDVILRETASVGVVGGIGFGWQLQESLSSFAWAEVLLVVAVYSVLTLIGEMVSENLSSNWIKSNTITLQNNPKEVNFSS